ncbi:hypothetical protein LI90_2299 [Carbonactinospora thermoautotrophica]|uniref:Fibronectin type-III domain-containing protein n=2 Tax=Carbonactinospora thermoautotrophica TaxID=1469144 RepID=A0A132MTU7_9ACTN|nr:hypothetical protein LI90_2299 [Carbonactinospora thermoautotrophica]
MRDRGVPAHRLPRQVRAAAAAGAVALALCGVLTTVPAAGPAEASSGPAAPDDCRPDPAAPKRQFRALWIASVLNIDWPSKPGLSVAQQQAEYLSLLDVARKYRLNAVILQVRPTADAFWPSRYEPWSQWLTGQQGKHPGYDPLAFAVRAAHERNLEFHAWFNPYRVSMQADPAKLAPGHPAREHPEWIVRYGGKLYYNPGVPEARRFVQDAILDAVARYDVDGIHFDDYFYPYPVAGQDFPDDATYRRYGADFARKADWRRHNVDLLVSELSRRIHALKPWVKFGVSPFGVWRNKSTDPAGSDTRAGVQTYDDLYADTRKWVREEWLDYVVPQVYWAIGHAPADYAKLVPWWARQVAGTRVHLYIGQALYKVGSTTQSPGWSEPTEMTRHLTVNRRYPRVAGDVYFSAKDVRANRLGAMARVAADHYAHPALIPLMPHLGGAAPPRPVITRAERTARGVALTWRAAAARQGDATAYAIYRFAGAAPRCGFADARHLIAIVRAGRTRTFTDTGAEPGRTYTYYVTALDRLHQESRPSPGRTVK